MQAVILAQFAKFFFGRKTWGQLQDIVHAVEDPALTGAQKRALALEKAQAIAINLAGFMLNFALEAAVTYYKTKNES